MRLVHDSIWQVVVRFPSQPSQLKSNGPTHGDRQRAVELDLSDVVDAVIGTERALDELEAVPAPGVRRVAAPLPLLQQQNTSSSADENNKNTEQCGHTPRHPNRHIARTGVSCSSTPAPGPTANRVC